MASASRPVTAARGRPTLAQNAAARALYGAVHPLGVASIGTEASLKALDVASLRAFWQAHYRPPRGPGGGR